MGAQTPSNVRLVHGEGHQRMPAGEAGPAPDLLPARSHSFSIVHYEEDPADSDSPGTFPSSDQRHDAPRKRDPQQLSETIRERVRARTSDRIRDLQVIPEDGRIVIRGCCATFYTKQLAQHAAMGVIDDEVVVNEISVGIPR